jgi:tetratricopeptide (TPR) repeat protein
MALDMDKILPMTTGPAPRRKNRTGGCAWVLMLAVVFAGVGYYAWQTWGSELTAELTGLWGVRDPEPRAGGRSGAEGLPGAADRSDETGPATPSGADSSAGGGGVLEPTSSSKSDEAGPSAGGGLQQQTFESTPVIGASGEDGPTREDAAQATSRDAVDLTDLWRDFRSAEEAGEPEEQQRILGEILARKPEARQLGNALYRSGVLYLKQGKREKAVGRLKEAYERAAETVGGRLAAFVLANHWYKKHCGGERLAVHDKQQVHNWEAVRDAYATAIGKDRAPFLADAARKRLLRRLEELNQQLVFSPAECLTAEFYTVKRGDALQRIARKFEVHYDGIAAINGLRARRNSDGRANYLIRPGQTLKILPFTSLNSEAVVHKSAHTITFYYRDRWIKDYPICHGGDRTIPGEYTIVAKDAYPKWTDPESGRVFAYGHPRNILGTRWMGFDGSGPASGLGIHGTTKPESIPGDASNGCVRMYNSDVEELYGLLLLGGRVTILP